MTLLTEVDFETWLSRFIRHVTGMDEAAVFRGNQSRMVLPPTNEYCIYTPLYRSRIGTNVYSFDGAEVPDAENAPETYTESVDTTVQIDFYGPNASRYAQGMETAARADIANRYFRQNEVDLRVLYSTAPRNLTGLDASQQYVSRWSVDLHVQFDTAISEGVPWFEDVSFSAIKEVDTSFPPTKEE